MVVTGSAPATGAQILGTTQDRTAPAFSSMWTVQALYFSFQDAAAELGALEADFVADHPEQRRASSGP
jgi:hypothetical protein